MRPTLRERLDAKLATDPETGCRLWTGTDETCRAGNLVRGEWRECGALAVALHRYACVHEHVRDRWTCLLHQPAPGAVGCQQCADLGHECEMAWQPIPAGTAS